MVNPQKWNLYVYVLNNPAALSDPSGRQEKGSGGGRVIDVFLAFPAEQRNTSRRGVTNTGPDWEGIQKNAAKNGYTVNVHRLADTTIQSVSATFKTSNVVVIVGHGQGDTGSDGRWASNGVRTSDGGFTVGGTYTDSAPNVALPKPSVSAAVTCLFTCNSTTVVAPGSSAFSAPPSAIAVVNDGGADGETNVGTLENSAARFVGTYVDTNGNLDAAVVGAQAAINNSANAGRTTDAGDKLGVVALDIPAPPPQPQ